ncbi:MAG: hypothetical protein K0R20_2567 [Actinomycetia bacterium]|nr:hypothetical protein [Actinomycetes bacterium]
MAMRHVRAHHRIMQPDRVELDAEQEEPTVDCERGHVASHLFVRTLAGCQLPLDVQMVILDEETVCRSGSKLRLGRGIPGRVHRLENRTRVMAASLWSVAMLPKMLEDDRLRAGWSVVRPLGVSASA